MKSVSGVADTVLIHVAPVRIVRKISKHDRVALGSLRVYRAARDKTRIVVEFNNSARLNRERFPCGKRECRPINKIRAFAFASVISFVMFWFLFTR